VLAHHPDFSNGFRTRNAARVDRLFQILKGSATPLNLGDPGRTGAGVPDAVRAVSGQAPETTPPPSPDGTGQRADFIADLLEQLRQDFVTAGLL
jgi:hypothetical protein